MKISLFLTSLTFLCLAGCAIAPAHLMPVMQWHREVSLHELMSRTLANPDSPEGKSALGHFVTKWKEERKGEQGEVAGGGVTYRVRFQPESHDGYSLDYFDEISAAADFKVSKIKHHERAGAGAPLLALRENLGRQPVEAFYPPEAISRPLTAVARPGRVRNNVQQVDIELLCPLQNSSVGTAGGRVPLAADFSVPWAAVLERSGKLNQSRILDMITSTPEREPRLYMMEPYDPRKEPLIMIHGLLSTPLAWADLSNDLWADDTIRSRYQIWHYLYNTSAPALYSSRLLRQQVIELRRMLDPTGRDPASKKTTLITHSMGGLVGKALAVEPGDAFWNAAFKVPPGKLKLSTEDRARLKDAFAWQADRSIHRIIYIAVPHLGSDFADNWIGRIGGWLTRPPNQFRQFYERISLSNPGVFTPAYEDLGAGKLDGVNSLSPRQHTLSILAGLPFVSAVKTHSIIGNRGRSGPLEQSSDGIVPYSSSHIEGVESEVIVPASHGAFRHPLAEQEIMRILKL